MLDVKTIEARNFLSYGDVWTSVDIKSGINLVTGLDVQKKRSNGAGKTSFMEIVIFSLFGQVSKGLKQSQIINWKNKKSCETKTTFTKGGHEYLFHRGLKPNFLKVFKDGQEYPVNASVKEFQTDLEDQIIGMDFKTFNSLIYSNPNNSISLLDTPKAQKRQFIEKQFNLTEFSALNLINNDCIKAVDLELHDLDKDIKKNNELIQTLQSEKDTLKTEMKAIDFDALATQRIEIVKKIKKLSNVNDTNINRAKDALSKTKIMWNEARKSEKEIESKKNDLKQELIETLTTIKSLKKQKEDIGDVTEYLAKIDKVKKALLMYDDVEERLQSKKDGLVTLREQLSNLTLNYADHTSLINGWKDRIKAYNIDGLKDKAKCPTCYQEVDFETIKADIDKEINMLQGHIDSETETRGLVEASIKEFKDSIQKREDDIKAFEDRVKKKQEFEKALIKLNTYVEKHEKIKDIDKQIEELSDYQLKKETIDKLALSLEGQTKIIEEYDIEIKRLEKSIEDDLVLLREKDKAEKDLVILDNDVEHKKDQLKKLEERLEIKREKILGLTTKCLDAEVDIRVKTKEKDHFVFVKDMLKDENIKQFAISHMIPIIERQANYYLGEAGFGFYLKLDSWIDAEIKGPGITDCSFASMSGGERKSIDLALKFAIMDISVARNPDFPNILILDELLDSSVDAYGIQQLVDVVKVKQKKNNLKVFIISHREEMNEIEPDHLYLVKKVNGFSSVIEENV